MKGIAKVIDELGLIILSKEEEIEIKEKDIDILKRRIEVIEMYMDTYVEKRSNNGDNN